MESDKERVIKGMFFKWCDQQPDSIEMLPPSGSYREYYRVKNSDYSALGVYNEDSKENAAFIGFSKHFFEKKIPVPEIYVEDAENRAYLIQDFGSITLFDYLNENRVGKEFSHALINVYKQVLKALIEVQIEGGKDLDYNLCYPRKAFDKQSMMWDLSYFKYYFLKLGKVPFDEQLLEDDYNTFVEYLLKEEQESFLYRDFQSRNVMLEEGEVRFIDFQGGRRGALQYDVASLLFDAKADLPVSVREELLQYYIDELKKKKEFEEQQFIQYYHGYVLIRIMQAMGAYGFRGMYEKKAHFLKSIPYALDNLRYVLENSQFEVALPHLTQVLWAVADSSFLRKIGESADRLTIVISSFSYKRGIPFDPSGNGGGFVFDCRSIHNPGRYPEYKEKTGRDAEVISFFEKEDEMTVFLDSVYKMVGSSVEKYVSRGFKHLMVSFGCTGGQHRSVYCAENLKEFLINRYPVNVSLKHVEQELLGKI